MKKKIAFLGAILSLIPLGKPVLIKTVVGLSSSVLIPSSAERVNAETADFYFMRGVKKYEAKDYAGCISELNEAIAIKSLDAIYYLYRGNCKYFAEDYYGAISDITQSIDLGGQFLPEAYGSRGISKVKIGDLKGACSDWRKAYSLGDEEIAKFVKNRC